MYLPTLTNDELLRYAETQTLTPLEAELVKRFSGVEDEVAEQKALVESLEEECDAENVKVAVLEAKIKAARESLA